ncbi:sensor histidine kinase [Aquimarina rhabdastrellae]
MKKQNQKQSLYLIILVIFITLLIQVYWNIKNYQASKQQLVNEVQIALDNAVDHYYTDIAKEQSLTFIMDNNSPNLNINMDSIRPIFSNHRDTLSKHIARQLSYLNRITSSKDCIAIPFSKNMPHFFKKSLNSSNSQTTIEIIKDEDSLSTDIKELVNKTFIAVITDSVHIQKVDTLITQELQRKNIDVSYGLLFKPLHHKEKKLRPQYLTSSTLSTLSKSAYLPKDSSLKLFFTNTTLAILKRNLVGIFLSTLLVSSIIACLFYLLKIINYQKQLSEVKNDLISNITHEFKTPIATIGVALEGIVNFNQNNDLQKTKKYVQMSSEQLDKLNTMVEKLLETATLDSENLELNLEEHNIVDLLELLLKKHKNTAGHKHLSFSNTQDNIWKKIDLFHFENALNNIIDNAVKYGGDQIDISVEQVDATIIISIIDNGTTLTSAHKEKIFEKFYRIPKGNTHDVKGFGIGLYYTKKIIEKHQGTIELLLSKSNTHFKITLPNV